MMFSYVGRSGLPGRRAALLLALGIFLWELGITGCLVLRREKIPVSAPIAAGWKVATLQ